MADLSSVTDNYLPTASETFSDNLSSSIAAEAAIVPVNSGVEYADGDTVVLTVAPGTANEATFVGKKDAGQNRFIECIWTEGNTAVGHDAGTTIIDYDSATHYNLLSEALQLIMNQDGTLKDDPIRTALGLSELSNDGWEVFPYTFTVSSGYNKGNKEHHLTVANQDVTGLLSPGMRLRLERSTAAPTQCMDLESGSSQYASRASGSLTGITFTDDFTIEFWAKPESYHTADRMFVSRLDAAANNGFFFQQKDTGQLRLSARNAGGANERYIESYQSIELDKWSHIAAHLDMSAGTGKVYINGVDVPAAFGTGGTNPTSLVQGGDLHIGNFTSNTQYFDGKLSDVRIWNVVRTATQIRDNMNQQLVGNETNLVGYWKLAGNLNDSTSNANNLTGSGGAVATDTDHPMQSTEYAIITKVSYSAPNSTVVVFTGTAHNIPNMTLNSPYYSVQKVPFGFPIAANKWEVTTYAEKRLSGSGSLDTYGGSGAIMISVPTGEWDAEYNIPQYSDIGSGSNLVRFHVLTLSTTNNTETMKQWTSVGYVNSPSNPSFGVTKQRKGFLSMTTQTPLYIVFKESGNGGISNNLIFASASTANATGYIRARCAYV